MVYTGGAGSGGTLYAVDAATGAVLWTQPVANGDDSSPAVTANGVYVSYACEQTYAFAPESGNPIWHHETDCSGGGGRTPVLADGGVWVRDDAGMVPSVLNAADGKVRGSYEAAGWSPAPAFDGRQGYFVDDGVLQERHSRTLATRWKFEGDGQISTAPIVVNGYVYVGSRSGRLWALNGATGQPVWSADVGASINEPDEHHFRAADRPRCGRRARGGPGHQPAGGVRAVSSGGGRRSRRPPPGLDHRRGRACPPAERHGRSIDSRSTSRTSSHESNFASDLARDPGMGETPAASPAT